jgi:hypothetical protein
MKIAQVASRYDSVPPKPYERTECVMSVMLRCVFQRAAEQRLTAARPAHQYVRQFESGIARNQDVSEAV